MRCIDSEGGVDEEVGDGDHVLLAVATMLWTNIPVYIANNQY